MDYLAGYLVTEDRGYFGGTASLELDHVRRAMGAAAGAH